MERGKKIIKARPGRRRWRAVVVVVALAPPVKTR